MPPSIAASQSYPLTPEQVVQELRHLPSAPKVLPLLKRLLSDGNSAMHDIVGLIRLDQLESNVANHNRLPGGQPVRGMRR